MCGVSFSFKEGQIDMGQQAASGPRAMFCPMCGLKSSNTVFTIYRCGGRIQEFCSLRSKVSAEVKR